MVTNQFNFHISNPGEIMILLFSIEENYVRI